MNDPKHLRGGYDCPDDAWRAAKVITTPLDDAGRESLRQICETAVAYGDRDLNEAAGRILRKSCLIRSAVGRAKGN